MRRSATPGVFSPSVAAGAGATGESPHSSQLFHNLNAAAGGYGLWVEHLAKAAPGRWGAIAATAATAPIGFGLSMGATGGDAAVSAVTTAADVVISAAGGGPLLTAARVGQVADHYAPSVGGMQSFYQSLDPDMQDLLGQPDLALYGILRGGVWLAARVGDAVDWGAGAIVSPIKTFQACSKGIKEMFNSLVPSAAAAEWRSASPEATQSLLKNHAVAFAATNGLNRGGRMAYLSCLEEALSDGLLRFDAETGQYQYPTALEALLTRQAGAKNDSLKSTLNAAAGLFSTENIESTREVLKDISSRYAKAADEKAQEFESQLSLKSELTGHFKAMASGRERDGDRGRVNFSASAKTVGETCYHLGNLGNQLATGAMLLGGHKRTWQGVSLASQGLVQFGQAAMALPGLISSGAGLLPLMSTGVGAAVALISIGVALFGNSGDEDNSLGEALSAIHSAVMGMWTEMRESFHITWEMLQDISARLDKMEANNHRHFGILLATLDYYGGQSLANLTYLKKSLHDHMSWMHYDLKSCLEHLIDERAVQVIGEINLKSEAELKVSMAAYTATLSSWLLDAAAKKSGTLPALSEGKLAVPGSELVKLLEDDSVLSKLGLLGSLANAHVTNLVDKAAFIDSSDWVYVLRAFELLIKTGSGEIALSEKKAEYLKHLLSIKARAESVTAFVVATMHGSSRLFASLLVEYQSALDTLGRSLREVVERKRVAMNQSHGLLGEQVLLRLDEHANQSLARIEKERAGSSMIKPIDWDSVSIEYNRSAPDVTHKIEASYSVALEPFMMSHERMRKLREVGHPLLEQIRLIEADPGFNLAHAYQQVSLAGRYSMQYETHGLRGADVLLLNWYCYRMNLVLNYCTPTDILPCVKGSLFVNEWSPDDHRAKPLSAYTQPKFECIYYHSYHGGNRWHVTTFGHPAIAPESLPKAPYETLKLDTLLEQNVLTPARKEAAKAFQSSELSIQLDRLEAVRLQLLRFIEFLCGDATKLEKQLLGKASFIKLAAQLEEGGTIKELQSIFNALWVGASPKEQNSALLHLQAETVRALAGVRIMDHPLVLDMLVARNIVDYLQDLIARKATCDLLQERQHTLGSYVEKLKALASKMADLERQGVPILDQSSALARTIAKAEQEQRELVEQIRKLGSETKASIGKEVPRSAGVYPPPATPKVAAAPAAGRAPSAGIFAAPTTAARVIAGLEAGRARPAAGGAGRA